MNIVFYILKQKIAFIGKILKGKEMAPKIVFSIFAAIFLLIGVAEFFGFLRAFRFLSEQEFFGPPLTLFVLEQFFLFVFVLFILSASLSGFFVYYRSSDIPFLLSTPVTMRSVFFLKYVETLFISSWPVVLLGMPLVLAFAIGMKAGVFFIAVTLCALAAFLFFSLAGATLVVFGAGLLFKLLPRIVSVFIAAAAFFAGGYALALVMVPRSAVLSAVFEAGNLESSIATTAFIEKLFFWWPSHWLSLLIFSGAGNGGRTFFIFSGLAALAAVFSAVAFSAARIAYPFLLFSWRESVFYANGRKRIAGARVYPFPRFCKSPAGAVVEKDVLMFARNYQEMARAGFILFLLFVYLAAIVATGRRIGRIIDAEGIVLALHLVAVSYFATTLALQFVFPSVSLEGRAAGALWSSPVNRRSVFIAKYAFWSVCLFGVMEILLLLTASPFGLSGFAVGAASIFLLLLVSSIVSVSLAFGTYFPNFHESNVDRLATSMGGLLTAFVSLAYGLFIGIANFMVLNKASGVSFWVWFLSAFFISSIIIILSLRGGMKRIKRLEVV